MYCIVLYCIVLYSSCSNSYVLYIIAAHSARINVRMHSHCFYAISPACIDDTTCHLTSVGHQNLFEHLSMVFTNVMQRKDTNLYAFCLNFHWFMKFWSDVKVKK